LKERAPLIAELAKKFTLRLTGAAAPKAAADDNGPLAGKSVVFTGTMASGSREQLQEQARKLGATVQSSVNGKTDYLVCGEKVGAAKTSKASALGVKVITEAEYLTLLTL